MAYTPARSSSACVANTPGESSMKSGMKVTASPTATRSSAAALPRAPMSRNCSCIGGALSRSSAGMMCVGLRPPTACTSPLRPWTTKWRPGTSNGATPPMRATKT